MSVQWSVFSGQSQLGFGSWECVLREGIFMHISDPRGSFFLLQMIVQIGNELTSAIDVHFCENVFDVGFYGID